MTYVPKCPNSSVERPLDRKRQHQLCAIMLAAVRRAVVAEAALRTFFQQVDALALEPTEHIAPHVCLLSHTFSQVLVLVHETDLCGDPFEQAPVCRGIRLVRHPQAQEQHSNQPVASSGDRNDQPDAKVLKPASLFLRKFAEVRWKIANRLRAFQHPNQSLLLR